MSRLLLILWLILAPLVSFAQSNSHREAALRLIDVSGSDELLDQVYEAILPDMMSMAGDGELPEEERAIFERYTHRTLEIMQEEMNWTALSPHLVEIYVSVYSEEEINELIEFYSSSIGQKMLERSPEVAAQTMQVVQGMMQRVAPRLEALYAQRAEELLHVRQQRRDND